jgi:enamine deaminase RidA (YjgF/YER057c/UK114 family)
MFGHRLHVKDVWSFAEFPINHVFVEPVGKSVHLTGQVGRTECFETDAAQQTLAAIDDIQEGLAYAGGTIEDVVSCTLYYVRDEDLDAIQQAFSKRFSVHAGLTVTGVKVAGVVGNAVLVELSAIAVVPPRTL